MKKSYVVAGVVSLPLLLIAFREAGKLLAGFSDPEKSSPASILWIFAIFVVLTLLWASVLLISRRARPSSDRLPFAAAAAIAMREAKKRPPAAKCAACGRARISDSVAKCLYCGHVFPSGQAGSVILSDSEGSSPGTDSSSLRSSE